MTATQFACVGGSAHAHLKPHTLQLSGTSDTVDTENPALPKVPSAPRINFSIVSHARFLVSAVYSIRLGCPAVNRSV